MTFVVILTFAGATVSTFVVDFYIFELLPLGQYKCTVHVARLRAGA